MNEPPISPVADFKDRRGGLIGFGILVIIIGCICAWPWIPGLNLNARQNEGRLSTHRIDADDDP